MRRSPITIPNLLSLLRMGLTPLFIISVVNGQAVAALAAFAAAGITDALDGYIARSYGQQSKLGAYLDPIADKMLLMSAYVVLAVPGLHRGALIPAWVTVLVIARDLIILTVALVSYLALGTRRFQPNLLSKVNTTVQIVTAIAVLASGVWLRLIPLVSWLPYAVAASTVASGVSYLHERAVQVEHPVSGEPPSDGESGG
ncbi:MAG TPA: CDP-alcohol phosphatidyltransferase family protein [Thermoanaerobaculia bacterium]|nr:CDP-alcohol phosphatidyltransferase family protein [Thermoanaerobaculia bacterium]